VYGVSLEDLPLFWLGPAADDDSIRLLEGFYVPDASEPLRTSLAEAVALHRKPALVVPFLERIINNGREPEKLRADAAEFLGDQDDARALDVLRRTVRTDASLEVRKGAVTGLTEMEFPASADALIDLALHERNADVREDAIEGLAEKATKATIAVLEQLVAADKDVEIQKRAVSALADLPEKGGLLYLIQIAKTHPLRDVRVEAIEALGDFHDPAGAKALIEIIKTAR
jgi:HEAT repeat protein